MADFDFSGLRKASEPATATTSPGQLPETMAGMLPPGTQSLQGLTSPNPWDPYGHDTGAQVIQRGLPMAGGMVGSSLGPLGAAAGASLGEAGAEWLTGQPLNPLQIGASGALSGAGTMAGRMLSGGSRIAERAARESPTLQALGVRAPYATADSQDIVPLTGLKSMVDQMSAKWNAIIPSTVRPVPTTANKIVSELDQLKEILDTGGVDRPLSQATTIRDLLAAFVEGGKNIKQARALYGAYMGDLRQAASGGSQDAAAYLHDLGNDKIVRSLFPENMLERMLIYGSASLATMGNPGVALPTAGILGYRAYTATPRSVLDTLGAGTATLANPYHRRP